MLSKKETEAIHVVAPGRICLFGDHQDYLGLPVIFCAINRFIKLSARSNNKSILRINMPDIGQQRSIDLRVSINPIGERDYFASALKVIGSVGCIPNRGFDIEICGNIPINAGLSSSSAIVVAWVTFLLEAYGVNMQVSTELIASLAYKAEVLEYRSPGGLMDQYTISLGGLLYLNTVDGTYTRVDKNLQTLIIGESGVPKQTLGVLGELRGLAQEAILSVQSQVRKFKIKDANMDDYEQYKGFVSDKLRPIFYASIKNYEITKEAFYELNQEKIDLAKIGSLMTEHHNILKDILKITVPIIDKMIAGALSNGALGAKIVGSGGGGSIVALTTPGNEDRVIKGMLDNGATFAYKVDITRGVSIV